MELYEPSAIREIKNRFGFRFSKSLGQNFLIDRTVLTDIVDGAEVSENDLVIEIGPGIGTLTRELAASAGKVVAVEIDDGLIEVLRYTLADLDNVEVVHENILKTDIDGLIREHKGDLREVKVVGNLPYYITTAIITKVLDEASGVKSLTVMMQKEVAERLLAEPGGRDYGAITVSLNELADAVPVRIVTKDSFMPSPKVDSEVIRLDILEKKRVEPEDEELFRKVIKAAFSQRRKKLINSLAGAGFDKEAIREVLEGIGIKETARAEELSVEDYRDLSDSLYERGINV